jgi:hypothetical protein
MVGLVFGRDLGVDMLGHDVFSVHQTASHVRAVSGAHLTIVDAGLRTELVISANGVLAVSLLGRDYWGVRGQHEMDSWVWC